MVNLKKWKNSMKQKDLAEEYADLQRQVQQDAPEEVVDLSKGIFGYDDIKAAFNAGRESVVENTPELKWKRVCIDGLYLATTIFNWFYRIEFIYNEFHLSCNGYFISCYISLSDAKQAANEHYKKQIQQALGL